MTATHGVGTYGNAVGTVTPLDHKMAQLGLIVKTGANTIRPGVFWDGNATIVSGKANMSYDVRALAAALSRSATAGAVLLANDAVYNVLTTAAPGSNSRYDVVYLWQREFSLDGTDSNPVIGVVQGTPAASPTVPSLAAFPGAIALAQILVPAGVVATNSGTTITQTAPFTASAGGTVAVRNTAERDAGAWIEGQLIELLDTHTIQRNTGSGWVTAEEDTGWVTATLGNSWTSTAGLTVQYRRVNGIVYLRGRATGGTTGTMFTLPAGFRPGTTGTANILVQNGSTVASATQISWTSTGVVTGVSGAQPVLDGLTFPAEN